ncbi:type II secretion system F family protein [Actinoplanes sp. NPDC020271]|uniref:type II secretion system F family protein n=1 Tax=Actinoplanes sp. NPDC020271 TaxID=3363896 RepID=UPI00379004F8
MNATVVAVAAAAGSALAVVLAALAAVLPAPRRDRILRALAHYGSAGPVPAGTARSPAGQLRLLLRALADRCGDVLTSERDRRRLVQGLDYAGNPPAWPLPRVIRVRPLAALATALLGAAVGHSLDRDSGALPGTLLGLVGGFLLPRLLLHNAGVKRRQQVLRSLPDVMDALVIAVEAGLGLDSAMDHVSRSMTGPMSDELRRVLQEMRLGVARAAALRALADRTTVRDLKRLVTALVQAGELGISVANILREHAQDQRVRRRQRAEELAQKVPVKLIFPVMFCMLPAIFVILIGPAVLQLIASFE